MFSQKIFLFTNSELSSIDIIALVLLVITILCSIFIVAKILSISSSITSLKHQIHSLDKEYTSSIDDIDKLTDEVNLLRNEQNAAVDTINDSIKSGIQNQTILDILSYTQDSETSLFKSSLLAISNNYTRDIIFKGDVLKISNRDTSILGYIYFWEWLKNEQIKRKEKNQKSIVYRAINCIEFKLWEPDNKESETFYKLQRKFLEHGGIIYRILIADRENEDLCIRIKNKMEGDRQHQVKVHYISKNDLKSEKEFTHDFLWLFEEGICFKWIPGLFNNISRTRVEYISPEDESSQTRKNWTTAFDAAYKKYGDKNVFPEDRHFEHETTYGGDKNTIDNNNSLDEETTQKIRNLISKGKQAEAIELLINKTASGSYINNEAIALKSRLEIYNRKVNQGVSHDGREINDITQALLNLLPNS